MSFRPELNAGSVLIRSTQHAIADMAALLCNWLPCFLL
jgi:hypothetical protein